MDNGETMALMRLSHVLMMAHDAQRDYRDIDRIGFPFPDELHAIGEWLLDVEEWIKSEPGRTLADAVSLIENARKS